MKKITFMLVLILSSVFPTISQNCPDLGPDQILQCGVLSTTLTADLSNCVGGSSPKSTSEYQVSSIPYVAQTNNGSNLFMSDDSQQGPINIGFTFCFYGSSYNNLYVGSNGWVSFSPSQPTTFTSSPIPSGAGNVPKNCIMGPWQDWHPGLGGNIRYQLQGTAPCRKMVISWINVPMFSCVSSQGNFHIVLYESTNVIETYIQNKPPCLQWQGGTAVHGLHNQTGTLASVVPGRNSTAWVANNDAWRWTPDGPDVNPLYVWYQVGNPTPLAYGLTYTVTPPAAGAEYTCHTQWPSCNSGWNVCNGNGISPPYDTVLVIPGIAPIINSIEHTDTICVNSNLETYNIDDLGTDVDYYWSWFGNPLNQNNDTIQLNWNGIQPDTYLDVLEVYAINSDGCSSDTISIDLVVYEEILNIDSFGPLCSNDSEFELTALPQNGVFSGVGVVNDTLYPPLLTSTNNTVTYTFTQSGCVFDTMFNFNVYQQPNIIDIAPNTVFYEICLGDELDISYEAITNLPGNTEWFVNGELVIMNGNILNVVWDEVGEYQIDATHYYMGCPSEPYQLNITVAPCPELIYYIPNSFTPNGDEFNNTFKPVFTNGFDPYDFNLKIYNRWGELIWESNTPNESWDGTYGGKKVPLGTYNCIVVFGENITAKKYQIKTSINVIR